MMKEKRRGIQSGKRGPLYASMLLYELSIDKHMFHKSTYERRSHAG